MPFRPDCLIQTSRLTLRPPIPVDAEAIFGAYGQDPEVSKYTAWQPHDSIETTQGFLAEVIDAWHGDRRFVWVIEETGSASQPGDVEQGGSARLAGGIEARVEGRHVELGYVLRRSVWGKGYAGEAAQAIIEIALADAEVDRVSALCHVDHHASAAVLEKCGMRRDGRIPSPVPFPNLPGDAHDVYVYAVTG